MMSALTVLSALTNPTTQAAAFALLEIAASSMRLISDLDKPEMSDEDKRAAWAQIKRLNAQADAHLEAAIMSHPSWLAVPDGQTRES